MKTQTESFSFAASILLFLHSTLLLTQCQLLPIPIEISNASSNLETYIVHVQPPTTPNLLKNMQNWHASFLPSTTLSSGEPRLIYSYRDAISGFAARLTRGEVRAMEAMEGFVSAVPDRMLALHTTHAGDFLGLGHHSCFLRDTNLGKGLVIGVLDTGVFPSHPSFRDEGLGQPPPRWKGHCDFKPGQCNGKIVGAKSFKHGCKDVPIDDIGHGTHTASIAAGSLVRDAAVLGNAKGVASGVAPNAHLAIYKVCHSGGCLASDVLAGIDQAIADGVDVISISLGGQAIPFYDDSVAIGSLAAVEKGILVSCSAGNGGPARGTVENDAPWVMTVGASTMDRVIRSTVRLGDGTELDGESAYQPTALTAVMLPVVYPGLRGGSRAKTCSDGSLSRINVKGKIVICHVGGSNTSIEKGAVVKKAGAIAMILMNTDKEKFTVEAGAHVLPASHVSRSDASRLVAYVKSSPNPTATIDFRGTLYGASRSPAVASFSARGPSRVNEGVLKPDVVGPGVNILAAWPFPVGPASLELKNVTVPTFSTLSGTSMSAPMLAGVATLLKLSHPTWSPAAIKSAIMTSSDNLDREGRPMSDERWSDPAGHFATGAGHTNPSKANDPGLVYDLKPTDYLSYLCGLGYTDKQVSTVARRPVECSTIDAITAEELNYPSMSVSVCPYAEKTVTRTVTNVGGEESVYSAQISSPEGVVMRVYPEKLEFSEKKRDASFNVYFSSGDSSGMKGRVSEGQLRWVSGKHVVRSPVSVSFV